LEGAVKIEPTIGSGRVSDPGRSRTEGERVVAASPRVAPGAAVKFSELSARLAELEAKLAGTDAFDQKRIDEIKQAIANGQFSVNSGAVADKLLQNAREMLAGKNT
jgi:flagellar biosynthesis anti-sigma factor FlgM